ncbi:L-seryl-tRNA(Sec) selenium transferase [Caballeronia sp. ATUFL_M1_KS5A]|uniref:L-seryl-tRNA(Sec) selenium transferase n=1 Tax=Caballeronia sp. ATUFL_M1_KS5A TaxID=2921778 RepID=UPI00202973DD|nr:L-seryl-tRNA(Sec) selenium transferase [Caballeronia sp. ATUFL_M1_KS5A]
MTTRVSPSPFPSVDRLARLASVQTLSDRHGRTAVVDTIRAVLDAHRKTLRESLAEHAAPDEDDIVAEVDARLQANSALSLRRMFNLSGTVLHTNLGRALLPEAAVEHACMAMRHPCNLEFDLDTGGRGERDTLVESLLTEFTGAEAATVVNNNAAAVLLVLAALAHERDVVVSRGELVEIGGAFRVPDVMRSANARLVEVGTTNRTHKADYRNAIGPQTAALMKVHASNYQITGFTASVSDADVADIAHAHELPFFTDLGAGSLIDLSKYGLPREPVVRDVVAAGGDVVTFSGDKLLGGPQAGLIVGKGELIAKIKRHPLKRALRVSKMTLAALEATLMLYRNPDALVASLPPLRLLTRSTDDIAALARRIEPLLADALGAAWRVSVAATSTQVGSGSLPVDLLPSVALAIEYIDAKSGTALRELAGRLRRLPVPVIGRVSDNRLLLDLRCLEDEGEFIAQLHALKRAV